MKAAVVIHANHCHRHHVPCAWQAVLSLSGCGTRYGLPARRAVDRDDWAASLLLAAPAWAHGPAHRAHAAAHGSSLRVI